MNVIILPEVLDYLDEVVFILFEKQYFSYLETSKRYIDDLIDDIKCTLPIRQHKPAPEYFKRFIENPKQVDCFEYAVFKKNRHTSWYVFFTIYEDNETGNDIFLVRYIGNNHTVAQHL